MTKPTLLSPEASLKITWIIHLGDTAHVAVDRESPLGEEKAALV